jgi:glycosyltransferase involved in cell wall biosynthesis
MLSIIIPFYNESESLPTLIKRIVEVGKKLNEDYEIILINDGSTDKFISTVHSLPSTVKLISHRKRFGKGEALATGVKNARGDVIIFMDGDLQDEPTDIPLFLKKIEEGYDFVNGSRQKRNDKSIVKIYSFLAKQFLKTFLHSPYTDINCGFKAFRKEVITDFIFYGNNFRFFPLAAYYQGYRVTEMPVINNPRKYGISKFGITKIFIGIFDTLSAYFIFRFSEKPLHFFGPIGGVMFLVGIIIDAYLTFERIFFDVLLYRRPLLLYGIMFTIVGLQIIMTGIVAELIVYLKKNPKT